MTPSKRQETESHGMETPSDDFGRMRQGMRVAFSNEITTVFFLPSQIFKHVENLPTDATDNFDRLRALADSSATIDGKTAGWRQIHFIVACRTPLNHSVIMVRASL